MECKDFLVSFLRTQDANFALDYTFHTCKFLRATDYRHIHRLTKVLVKYRGVVKTIGSLRNHDDDGNKDVTNLHI